jgi:hypothetical protein
LSSGTPSGADRRIIELFWVSGDLVRQPCSRGFVIEQPREAQRAPCNVDPCEPRELDVFEEAARQLKSLGTTRGRDV